MIGELTGEGRTVFLSSHLLDEVEKTCDAAAVIDRGKLIAQGSIESLLAQDSVELEIGCDDPERALELLAADAVVADAHETGDGVRVRFGEAVDATRGAGAVNARLVSAGIAVFRLEPVRESLEERFLEMTSRVGGA